MITVADLPDVVANAGVEYQRVPLGDVEVQGRRLRAGDTEFFLDEDQLNAVGKYFKIPMGFLNRLPDRLITENLSYFLENRADELVVLETEHSAIAQVYDGSLDLLRREQVVGAIQQVLDPDCRVVRADLTKGVFTVDAVTEDLATQPRPGDYTLGGLRFVSHIAPKVKAPVVGAYLERLVCSNGMVVPEDAGKISIQGNTVPDIIQEMETAARVVLGGMDVRLKQWAHLSEVTIEDVGQWIHRLCNENKISVAMEDRILDRMSLREGDTLYDIVNLITAMWAEEGVTGGQAEALRLLGGSVVVTGGDHRCPSCASRLG